MDGKGRERVQVRIGGREGGGGGASASPATPDRYCAPPEGRTLRCAEGRACKKGGVVPGFARPLSPSLPLLHFLPSRALDHPPHTRRHHARHPEPPVAPTARRGARKARWGPGEKRGAGSTHTHSHAHTSHKPPRQRELGSITQRKNLSRTLLLFRARQSVHILGNSSFFMPTVLFCVFVLGGKGEGRV